jgi:hypothetical protein
VTCLGSQVARIGQQMAALAVVLFTLETFGSAQLAGLMAGLALAIGAAALALAVTPSVTGVVVAMALIGALQGPMHVALFTLRQRSTDPAWFGRAFAVSTAVNALGGPIGSAIGGVVVTRSLVGPFVLAAAAGALSAALIWLTVPRERPGVP